MPTLNIYHFELVPHVYCPKEDKTKIELEKCLENCNLWSNLTDNSSGYPRKLDCSYQMLEEGSNVTRNS